MANPNIVNVTSIFGKSAGLEVTTVPTAIVMNASGSGKILKVNVLSIANIDSTLDADITASIFKNQTTHHHLAFTITVPSDATMVILSKDTSIYLEENDSIVLSSSADGDLSAICSYEEIN